MLVVIAVLVGLPVSVLGQVLAENARSDFREAALDHVGQGAGAGASLVADRVSTVMSRTGSIATTTQFRELVGGADAKGLEGLLASVLPLYAQDVQRLYVLDEEGRFVASYPTQAAQYGVDLSRSAAFLAASNPWHPAVSPVTDTEFTSGAPAVTVVQQRPRQPPPGPSLLEHVAERSEGVARVPPDVGVLNLAPADGGEVDHRSTWSTATTRASACPINRL